MNAVRPLTVLVLVSGVLACGPRAEPAEATFAAAAGLARVQVARSQLVAAWDTFDELRREAARLGTPERPTAIDLARKSEFERLLAEAQLAFEAAYQADQAALLEFLNQALNVAPASAEARRALDLYAESAMRSAGDSIAYAGDYRRAIELLETAHGYFASAGLPPPAALVEAARVAREFRVVTRERFDRLAIGMTEEQAKALTGVPHHANVRRSLIGGKPVTCWLFGRDDGGVAALYFSGGKLYACRWSLREAAPAADVQRSGPRQ